MTTDHQEKLIFTKEMTVEFREAFDTAVREGRAVFVFHDREVLVDYGRYVLEFLENRFGITHKESTRAPD